jgi:CHAT domain-containing protein/tetratricopeptide (TPR) repeat protein
MADASILDAAERLAGLATPQEVAEMLARCRELLEPEADRHLTQAIQLHKKADDWQRICMLLAVRAFLADYTARGPATALRRTPLPLATACPLLELSRPVSEPDQLPGRIGQAACVVRQLRRESEATWWAAVHYIWGEARAQVTTGRRGHNFKCAARHYRLALEVWYEQRMASAWQDVQAARDWTETLLKIDRMWREATSLDPAGSIKAAISFYEKVLPTADRQRDPFERALLLHGLGNFYCQWPGGDRAENIEHALGYYQEALEIQAEREPEGARHYWSITRVGLANAYYERIVGERADNIERAIEGYQAALAANPHGQPSTRWAEIQYNLAVCYRFRRFEDRAENMERAIRYARAALRVYTPRDFPREWAVIQSELAALYHHRIKGQPAKNLERAIAHCRRALTVYTRQAFPVQWAQAQNSLANQLCDRLMGDPSENLEEAIQCYRLALEVRTPDTYPRQWAETQNNLGTVYATLGQFERAAACYRSALTERSVEALPEGARQTARNLGHLYFSTRNWAQAEPEFAEAMQAAEMLYLASATEVGKHTELAESAAIYPYEAYCLARLGRYAEAVIALEQGKARVMGEALARDRAQLQHIVSEDRKLFEQARIELKKLEAEQHAPRPDRPFTEIAADLRAAHERLHGAVARIRGRQPDFMPETPSFSSIAAAARPGRPLVYLATTSQGSLAIIVPAGAREPTRDYVVWLDQFKEDDLISLLITRGENRRATGGYLLGQLSGQAAMLKEVLDRALTVLGQHMMAALGGRLRRLGFSAITLIPSGRLNLLPLHAACQNGQFFGDEFQVAYAPSARTLTHCHGRLAALRPAPPALFAVGNPLPVRTPLNFARVEVETIASLFADRQHLLVEDKATYQRVFDALTQKAGAGAQYLHFSCHGIFNSDEPLISGLIMAEEKRLTLADLLDRLTLGSARLAVLSACQTAITDFNRVPDEAIGLSPGFLVAGVPGVIGSLWPVDDISTMLLMKRLYEHLLCGLDPAQALCQAQVWLRSATASDVALADYYERRFRGAEKEDAYAFQAMRYYRAHPDATPFAHPYYWAGFVFNGVGA